MSQIWYSYSHFHKKGYFILYNKKKHFALKKVVFYWASKSVEKGVFLPSKICEKGVFFELGYEHGICFGLELRAVLLSVSCHT